MDYAVEEIAPGHWRVEIAGTVRMIRHRPDIKTFAPWDICSEDGRRLWGSPTLESAFRWIQARTGHPTEGIDAIGAKVACAATTAELGPRENRPTSALLRSLR